MPGLISVSLIICEKLLLEQDAASAIRIIDVFFINAPQGIAMENISVPVYVLAIGKLPADDREPHKLRFELHRPDGEITPIAGSMDTFGSSVLGAPGGFQTPLQLTVSARQPGTHYIVFFFDDAEVARAPFTLVLQPPPAGQ